MVKRITNLFLGLVALVALLGLNAMDSNAGNRRILVEDHTGARCGWCVLGNQALDDLQAKYPNDFIGIGMHTNSSSYGDAMWTKYEPETAAKIGLTGFPSGAINRQQFSGKLALHPVEWESIVDQEVGKPAVVDVDVTWNLDKSTGALTATVSATMLADYNGQLAFNLYVMEDGVTGTGSQYDQINYVSNNPQYKNHPYYSKPNPIKGYEHNNVLRDMLGGSFGTTTGFPATATKGSTYTHTYTSNIKSITLDLTRVYVVGAVMETGSKMEILNAIQVGKVVPVRIKAPIVADAATKYLSAAAVGNKTITFTVSNPGTKSVTSTIALDETGTYIPEGWTYNLDKNTVTIAAGKSEVVTATINPNGKAGYATIALSSTPTNLAEGEAKTVTTDNAYVLSQASKYVWFTGFDQSLTPQLQAAMAYTQFFEKAAFVPYDPAVLSNFTADIANIELAVVTVDNWSRGALGQAAQKGIINIMQGLLTSGKKVLLTANVDLFLSSGGSSSFTPTAEAKSFFNSYLGITFNGNPITIHTQNAQGQVTAVSAIDCAGFADDFVGKGKSFKINEYNNPSHMYYSQWVDKISITGAKTTPAMFYTAGTATGMDAIAAVRYENGNSRAWFSTFGFELMMNAGKRIDLFKDVVNWLINGEEVAPTPVITLSTNKINFGDVKEGESQEQTFEVSNTGNLDLEISDIALDFGSVGFELVDDFSTPLIIKSGEKHIFTVKFIGETGNLGEKYDAITFVSNDIENPSVSVELEGNTVGKDVEPTPKVAVSTSTLTFNAIVGANQEKTVDIENKGTATLTVTKLEVGATKGYSLVNAPSLPLNIDKGQKVTLKVKFAPTAAGTMNDVLAISSNDAENPVLNVSLNGTATGTSVRDGIAGDEGTFTITATPSPMTSAATINYNVYGNTPRNLNIYIVDNAGARVQDVISTMAFGENSINFNANALANGTYFIVANLDGYQTQLPIVIAR